MFLWNAGKEAMKGLSLALNPMNMAGKGYHKSTIKLLSSSTRNQHCVRKNVYKLLIMKLGTFASM